MGWTFSHVWDFDLVGGCYCDRSFWERDDELPVYRTKGLLLD